MASAIPSKHVVSLLGLGLVLHFELMLRGEGRGFGKRRAIPGPAGIKI